ncbi:MAG: hypothetical protein GY774_40230 [Planctomycetes bacterium]|nr:hypothetical protein [Planctomycetota bacterium]
MVANIEQEYSNYVCHIWQEIADVSKYSLEPHQELEHTYNTISVASNQFLQEKLKALEVEKDPFYTD